MNDIFNMLMEAIDESAFPVFFAKPEYRRLQHCLEQQMRWLEDHLTEEQKAHFAQVHEAELRIATLEQEALVKTALAAGIRFALPG